MATLTHYMQRPLSDASWDRLGSLPEKYRAAFGGLPRFVCVSARGGRKALWRSAIFAEDEHFDAAIELRDYLIHHTQQSRDALKEARDALRHTGAKCIADLAKQAA